MFSNHLLPLNTKSHDYLLLGAGLLLVTGLLAAIAMVAGAQVQKAQMRDSMLASQRTAIAQCMENLGGTQLNQCMVQARASISGEGRTTTVADNSSPAFSRSTATAGGSQGFIPVAFSTHR